MTESRKAFATRIRAMYATIERAAESSTEAHRLLIEAFEAAKSGEWKHRRMGHTFVPRPYRQPVDVAAKYFVVKWYLAADPGERLTALAAATMRQDKLYASALRRILDREGQDPYPDMTELAGDYVTDIVGDQE